MWRARVHVLAFAGTLGRHNWRSFSLRGWEGCSLGMCRYCTPGWGFQSMTVCMRGLI